MFLVSSTVLARYEQVEQSRQRCARYREVENLGLGDNRIM